jgi:hypothetical protein
MENNTQCIGSASLYPKRTHGAWQAKKCQALSELKEKFNGLVYELGKEERGFYQSEFNQIHPRPFNGQKDLISLTLKKATILPRMHHQC